MAAVACSYSGSASTSAYNGTNNKGQLAITGVSYETTTNKITVSWQLKLTNSGGGTRYNFIAIAGWIGGSEINFTHANKNSYYWSYSEWNDGSIVASGSSTFNATSSLSLSVKAMFNGGYTDERWNAGSYCVNGSGTLSITLPNIGNPSVSFSTVSRDRTNITASISASAGTNGGNVSVSTTLNNGSAKTGTSPSWGGLTPNTSYILKATATNSAGLTATSSNTVTTTGNAPTINSIVVSPSRTSVILSPNVSYDTNASFSSYSIRYGTSTSYGSTSTSTTISGLTPNTTYYYSMTVTDNWGRTSAAKTGSFKTTGNDPVIDSHGVRMYDQFEVEMGYSASFDTNDSLSQQEWDYGTSTSYGNTVSETNHLANLTPNTVYYYRLRVKGVQGRTGVATGSFKTDPETVTISALNISEITETTAKVNYTFNNPSNVASFKSIETIITKDGGADQTYEESNVIPPYSKIYDNLEPGAKYTYKTRVKIRGQMGTMNFAVTYTSPWVIREFETLASTPFVKINSDGTIKHYKGYALGKADVYNGYSSEWSSGIYGGTNPLVLNTSSNGVSKLGHIEVLPNTDYTLQIPEQLFKGQVRFFFTNSEDKNPTNLPITAGSTAEYHTSAEQTRLYISFVETESSPDFMLSIGTARYISCHVYKQSQKVMLDKESIVTLNNKIRYIDIRQKGYTKDGVDYTDGKIVELDVYDKLGNIISFGKSVTIEKGTGLNPENVTNGSHDGLTYCKLNSSPDTTIVRVDLGQEYSYDQIDRVILWREVDCIYQESRLYGLDSKKQITWKFQSYKSDGVYKETAEGYTARPRKAKTKHNIYITSLLNELDNPPFADKITINADWDISIPPVIADLTTHRVDAIIAANSGKLLKNDVGDLTALTTTEKSNLVDAINEIWNGINKTEEEFTVLDFVLESILCG